MMILGIGQSCGKDFAAALSTFEALLAMKLRLRAGEIEIIDVQTNIVNIYDLLGRDAEALPLRQQIYGRSKVLFGPSHENTIIDASNLARSLFSLKHYTPCKELALEVMPTARRSLGPAHQCTLSLRFTYAKSLFLDMRDGEGKQQSNEQYLDDCRLAERIFEADIRTSSRTYGAANKQTKDREGVLDELHKMMEFCGGRSSS